MKLNETKKIYSGGEIIPFLENKNAKVKSRNKAILSSTRVFDPNRLNCRNSEPKSKKEHKARPSWLSQLRLHETVTYSRYSFDDTHDVLRAAFQAYQYLPFFKNFEITGKPSDESMLYQLINTMEGYANELGFTFLLVQNNNQEYQCVLMEEIQLGPNLSCELSFLANMESSNPALFRVIASLVTLLLRNEIPDWENNISFVLSTWPTNEEEEDIDTAFVEGVLSSIEYYQNGLPKEWLKRLYDYEPLGIETIEAFQTHNRIERKVITSALEVLNHPMKFSEYNNFMHDDNGILPFEYLFFSWDFTQPFERYYYDHLETMENGDCIVPARRVIPIVDLSSWEAKPYSDTFFVAMDEFFTSMQYLKTKYENSKN